MRKLIYIAIGLCFLIGCETEGFVPVESEPVFEFFSEIDGQEINIQAGVDGVENKGSFQEQNGLLNYVSSFSIPASSGTDYRKLSLHFKQYDKFTTTESVEAEVFNSELDYMLSFTGTEGLSLTPNTSSITDPFITAWTIDGRQITTQVSPLVPLPVLRDQDFVDVRYSLNIPSKFRGIMNSQFSLNTEEACHGALEIAIGQDDANLSFIPSNGSMDAYSWSTGETSQSIDIELVEQSLVMEASSADCNMNLQLDIEDPTALPNELSYDFDVVEGPATLMPYHGFVLELIDNTGEIFRSDYGIQNNSTINILSSESYGLDPEGNPALLVEGLISATLHNLDQDKTILIDNGNVKFAFTHPAN